mgnify:FL=1
MGCFPRPRLSSAPERASGLPAQSLLRVSVPSRRFTQHLGADFRVVTRSGFEFLPSPPKRFRSGSNPSPSQWSAWLAGSPCKQGSPCPSAPKCFRTLAISRSVRPNIQRDWAAAEYLASCRSPEGVLHVPVSRCSRSWRSVSPEGSTSCLDHGLHFWPKPSVSSAVPHFFSRSVRGRCRVVGPEGPLT